MKHFLPKGGGSGGQNPAELFRSSVQNNQVPPRMTMPEAPNERRSLNTNSNVNFFDSVGGPKSGAKGNSKAMAGPRRPAAEQLHENRLHL